MYTLSKINTEADIISILSLYNRVDRIAILASLHISDALKGYIIYKYNL